MDCHPVFNDSELYDILWILPANFDTLLSEMFFVIAGVVPFLGERDVAPW